MSANSFSLSAFRTYEITSVSCCSNGSSEKELQQEHPVTTISGIASEEVESISCCSSTHSDKKSTRRRGQFYLITRNLQAATFSAILVHCKSLCQFFQNPYPGDSLELTLLVEPCCARRRKVNFLPEPIKLLQSHDLTVCDVMSPESAESAIICAIAAIECIIADSVHWGTSHHKL